MHIPLLQPTIDRLLEASSLSLKYSKTKLIPLCVIVMFCFPLYYFLWKYLWPEKYENLSLRLIGSVGFFLLLFIKQIEYRSPKLASLIWFGVLTYSLAFFFQFMLLKNNISPVWIASTMIAMLLISLISYSSLMLFSMYGLGTLLACITYYYVEPDAIHTLLKFIGQLPIQWFCLFFSVFLNIRSEQVFQEKILSSSLVGSVAHELKTPLSLMLTCAELGAKYPTESSTQEYRAKAQAQFQHIYRVGNNALQLVEFIAHSAKQQLPHAQQTTPFSVLRLINEAIEEYFFEYRMNSTFKQKIHVDQANDFYLTGSETLLMHIIFNLLKNSIYYIDMTPNNRIEIWLENKPNHQVLCFKDYGPGIAESIRPYIFDSFSSAGKKDGTGLGLPFCKRAMQSFSGDIECATEAGKYTMFRLVFPKMNVALNRAA